MDLIYNLWIYDQKYCLKNEVFFESVKGAILLIIKIISFLKFKIIYYLLTGLNYVIPKSPRKVFLYDRRFRKDNVWAIAKFLSTNNKYEEYNVFYYTQQPDQYLPNIFFINNRFQAIWHRLRSTYIFHSYNDLYRFQPVRNQKIVDTMHGSPLKKIGYMGSKSKFNKLWDYESAYTHIICMSDFFKEIIQKSFGASDSQCLISGYPRNDMIFSEKDVLQNFDINKEVYKKVLLWLPTWREDGTDANRVSDISFPILNANTVVLLDQYLTKENILLIIKPHPIQLELAIFKNKYKNVKVFDNDDLNQHNVELYEMFNQIDALLTDYSSVYFDFLLTMKPIGFTIDDFDSYKERNGFSVENPLELMPGYKITTITKLITFIDNLKKDIDHYYEERHEVNELVNKYKDDKSTERLLEYLGL